MSNKLTTNNSQLLVITPPSSKVGLGSLERVSKLTGVSKVSVSDIVVARQRPMRDILKSGGQESDRLKFTVINTLDAIAEMYTSANYSNYAPSDKEAVFNEMMNFVLDRFSMLGVAEIRKAFSFAASGKINADLRAWHGKFTIAMLGGVLSAYKEYSKTIVFEYDKGCAALLGESSESEVAEKNKKARKEVIAAYLNLKETYRQDLEIDESKIFVHWGKILVDSGHINFTAEEKKEIYNEAKVLAREDIGRAMSESTRPNERRELRSLLDIIDQDGVNSPKFKNKATAKYAVLLVKKSIINQA